MTFVPHLIALAGACTLAIAPAAAQTARPAPPPATAGRPAPPAPPAPRPAATTAPASEPLSRGVILAGLTFQPTTSSFTDTANFAYFREASRLTGEYDVDSGAGIDLGVVTRLRGSFGAGLSVTSVARSSEAAYEGSYAHPFFFSRPRTSAFTVSDLDRSEIGVHLSAAYLVPSQGRFRVIVFGGPSFFSTTQRVVDDATVTETYPYDTFSLAAGTQSDLSTSMVGFHSGVDAAWYFSNRIGAGVLARFTTASKTVAIDEGEDFSLKVGGAQIGVGVRIKF